jgi:hypothetical protein
VIFNFQGQERRRLIVRLFGRTFVVVTSLDGRARSIKERKERADGVIRDETYWHISQGIPRDGRKGRRRSIVRTVLDAAGATYPGQDIIRLAA